VAHRRRPASAPVVAQRSEALVIHLLIMLYAGRLPGLAPSTASRSLGATLILWAVVLTAWFVACELLARIPLPSRTIGM
jgi:hypothetical protein